MIKDLVQLNNNKEVVTSSRTVAKVFEKSHDNVLRDVRKLIKSVHSSEKTSENYDCPFLTSEFFQENEYTNSRGRTYTEYLMNRDGFTLLAMGFTGKKALDFKLKYIQAFNKMEKALQDIIFRQGDKKHQLEMMEMLQDMLPKELKKEKVSYIKANTVVNKCTSNIFGFPKLLKKKEMNSQMLEVRSKVLDDYIKLFDVLQDNTLVTDALMKKYKKEVLALS